MKKSCVKRVEYLSLLSGEVYSLGIMQEIEIWSYFKMYFAQTRMRPGDWHNFLGFWEKTKNNNSGSKNIPSNNLQKKRTSGIVNFPSRQITESNS